MKVKIIKWDVNSDGEAQINDWLDKNPNIKIFSSTAVGYGYVNQYGGSKHINYTQIMYEELTSAQAKLTQLNS